MTGMCTADRCCLMAKVLVSKCGSKISPGRIVAPNITPDPETGAGNWSDDQLSRAIQEGIG